MTIRYLSFAFAGCLFNTRYWNEIKKSPEKGIAHAVNVANKTLLKQLAKEGKAFSKTQIVIGSTFLNFQAAYCPAALAVSKTLRAPLDPLLMEDIVKELKPGVSFNRIIKGIVNHTVNESQTVLAESYPSIIPLLFAQLYKAVEDNPNEEILFEVWTGSREDIDEIEKVFTTYRNFIPADVQLRIRLYDGEIFELEINLKSDKSLASLSNFLNLAVIMNANLERLDINANLERLDLFSKGLGGFVPVVSSAIYPTDKSQDNETEDEVSSSIYPWQLFLMKPMKAVNKVVPKNQDALKQKM